MVRRNFAEIMKENNFDVFLEYQRLHYLFYEREDILLHNTMEQAIDSIIMDIPIRKGALSLSGFEREHRLNFKSCTVCNDLDYLITFCEYCMNFCQHYEKYYDNVQALCIYRKANPVIEQVRVITDKIHYKEILVDGHYIYVEENPAAVSVAETLEGEIALETLRYNHHSMKGDLVAKRNTLAQMANWLEPKRGELKELEKELEGTLFFLFNRCSIRHNNEEEGNHFNPQMQNISKKELEEIYDDTYQLWLLAVLTLDNKERKAKYGTMKNESKALKN